MNTLDRLKAWLANPANQENYGAPYVAHNNPDKPAHTIMRSHFVTTNGITISIQQGATHYCTHDSVEMWCCPHRPILDPYGDGEDPYARVPLDVVAAYIDELEST